LDFLSHAGGAHLFRSDLCGLIGLSQSTSKLRWIAQTRRRSCGQTNRGNVLSSRVPVRVARAAARAAARLCAFNLVRPWQRNDRGLRSQVRTCRRVKPPPSVVARAAFQSAAHGRHGAHPLPAPSVCVLPAGMPGEAGAPIMRPVSPRARRPSGRWDRLPAAARWGRSAADTPAVHWHWHRPGRPCQ
jgi:hypothetical protein